MVDDRKPAASRKRQWFREFPDPMVLIFMVLVVVYAMAFFVPASEFAREVVEWPEPGNSRLLRVPCSDIANLHFFRVFVAIPEGMINAAQFLFIVFIAGGLFHILKGTGALENAIGIAAYSGARAAASKAATRLSPWAPSSMASAWLWAPRTTLPWYQSVC